MKSNIWGLSQTADTRAGALVLARDSLEKRMSGLGATLTGEVYYTESEQRASYGTTYYATAYTDNYKIGA